MRLPDGWKKVPLHEVAEVRTGLAKGKKDLKDPVELPYMRVANVQDGHFDLREIKTIEVERGQVERYALQAGDILMTEGGDFDKLGRGDVWRGQISLCLHQNHVFAVRPKRGVLNSEFLAALSASEYGRNYFLGCAKRSTNLASINASQLKSFPVLMPPFSEQGMLASVISAWDNAISVAERLHANSLKNKEGLVHLLLSNSRQKRQGGKPLQKARASQIFFPKSVRNNSGLPLLSVMQDVGVVPRDSLMRKVVMPEGSTNGYKRIDSGDFVITLRSFEGGVEYCRYTGLVSPAYIVLKPKKKINDDFYRHYFKSREFISRLAIAVIGIRDGKQISYDDFAFLNIPSPPIAEQVRIAEILNQAEAVIHAQRSHVDRLRKEKQALMQQLLTGKRRVRLADAAVKVQKTTSDKASVKTPVGKKPAIRTPIAKDKRP